MTTPTARDQQGLSARLGPWRIMAALVTLSVFGVSAWMRVQTPAGEDPLWVGVALMLQAVIMILLGLLINVYHPENPFGWLAITGGVVFHLSLTAGAYTFYALLTQTVLLTGHRLLLALQLPFGFLGIIVQFVLMPMLFPDGRFASSGWRGVGTILSSILGLGAILLAIMPGQLESFGETLVEGATNPLGLAWGPLIQYRDAISMGVVIAALIGLVAGAASLIARWRMNSGVIRQQIKIVVFYVGLVFTLFPIAELAVIFRPGPLVDFIYNIALIFLWLGYPLAIGVAIFRYRLFDIDLIIRRTLQYAVITLLLGLTYFGGVVLLQTLFNRLTGGDSPLAVVASTLLIAALFTPVRQRVQEFVDRRFYRQKYDIQRTLEEFGEIARDEVDLEQIEQALVTTVNDAMQPEHVSLWLRDNL